MVSRVCVCNTVYTLDTIKNEIKQLVSTRDGTIHIFNFRFDFRYLTHGSIYSRYFSQPRHLSHNIFYEQF